ncbi:MAG: DUF892 family protein [Phycisphaerales bacterium]|jgi:ferritin-like metal-binding protein YciE
MRMQTSELQSLFLRQLRDAYSTETQLLFALPKLRDAATNANLREAFDEHLDDTREHARRLELLGEIYNLSLLGHHCESITALIKVGEDVISDTSLSGAAKDAALICAAQRVEHFEIALYGCVHEYASRLDLEDAVEVLAETLSEEKAADQVLTQIAVESVNEQAATESPR